MLPEKLAYDLTRRKNSTLQEWFYKKARKSPEKVRAKLLSLLCKELDQDEIDAHFLTLTLEEFLRFAEGAGIQVHG